MSRHHQSHSHPLHHRVPVTGTPNASMTRQITQPNQYTYGYKNKASTLTPTRPAGTGVTPRAAIKTISNHHNLALNKLKAVKSLGPALDNTTSRKTNTATTTNPTAVTKTRSTAGEIQKASVFEFTEDEEMLDNNTQHTTHSIHSTSTIQIKPHAKRRVQITSAVSQPPSVPTARKEVKPSPSIPAPAAPLVVSEHHRTEHRSKNDKIGPSSSSTSKSVNASTPAYITKQAMELIAERSRRDQQQERAATAEKSMGRRRRTGAADTTESRLTDSALPTPASATPEKSTSALPSVPATPAEYMEWDAGEYLENQINFVRDAEAETKAEETATRRSSLRSTRSTNKTSASEPPQSSALIQQQAVATSSQNKQLPASVPCPPAPSSAPTASDDYCAVCNHAGTLLLCARCVQVYHLSCLRLPATVTLDDIPDDWYCEHANKKCTTRTTPITEHEQLSDEQKSAFRWTSRPTTRGGLKYYTSFERGGERCQIGSVVSINLDDTTLTSSSATPNKVSESIGSIESMWQDMYGEHWLEVRWYFLPEETRSGRLPHHHAQECFQSARIDSIYADAIHANVKVLSYGEYMQAETAGEADNETYMCRARYNDDTGTFRPIVEAKQSSSASSTSNNKGGGGKVKKRKRAELDTEGCYADPALSAAAVPLSMYGQACAALQLSALPNTLPCREKEANQIHAFLHQAIRKGGQGGGGLYIAGVPGTGKTATVRQVIASLQTNMTKDMEQLNQHPQLVPEFQFIELNGMKLPDPKHAYPFLYKALTGHSFSPARACALLEQRFKSRCARRPVCVLLIDEIDYFLNRHQQLLYNLAEWPTHRTAKLITISISNTIHFPQLLHPRVQSRFVGQQMTFAPYNAQQLQTIIKQRLAQIPLFKPEAIEVCAKTVMNVSGDVRRALQICRRAAELCDQDRSNSVSSSSSSSNALIGINYIQRAISDFTSNPMLLILKCCAPMELLLFCALLRQLRTGSDDSPEAPTTQEQDVVTLSDCFVWMQRIAAQRGMSCTSEYLFLDMCKRLQVNGLIELRYTGQRATGPIVKVNVSSAEMEHALKDNEIWNKLMNG